MGRRDTFQERHGEEELDKLGEVLGNQTRRKATKARLLTTPNAIERHAWILDPGSTGSLLKGEVIVLIRPAYHFVIGRERERKGSLSLLAQIFSLRHISWCLGFVTVRWTYVMCNAYLSTILDPPSSPPHSSYERAQQNPVPTKYLSRYAFIQLRIERHKVPAGLLTLHADSFVGNGIPYFLKSGERLTGR